MLENIYMRSFVVDLEANALDNPDKIWCVCFVDAETSEEISFAFKDGVPTNEFKEFAKTVGTWVGHNFIAYDAKVLNAVCMEQIVRYEDVVDTLVLSRLFNYNIDGGHSLRSWGRRLGSYKDDYTGGWDNYNDDMFAYCLQDSRVTLKLYEFLKKKLIDREDKTFDKAIRDEHFLARICEEMHDNGFGFDKEKADEIYKKVTEKISELDEKILQAFPPKAKFIREVTPRATKHGTISRTDFRWWNSTDLSGFSVGSPFSLFEYEPFNPSSPKQMVERLWEAGWNPIDKTKGHIEEIKKPIRERNKKKVEEYKKYGWKVNERNLSTLPEDAPDGAKALVERIIHDSRRSTLEEWFSAYDGTTHSIHGRYNHIGAWTHRMSHVRPNLANIAAEKSLKYQREDLADIVKEYGKSLRSLWRARGKNVLVGTDAEGIQLRILAHYINDPAFTHALIAGRKEDQTDCHSLNQKALGSVCRTRDNAKTFIYAWLLGAGNAKVAEIFGCSTREAASAVDLFVRAYPGLERLKNDQIPRDAARGYFIGFDGRLVVCDSEHLMLAGYLQNGEKVVIMNAVRIMYEELVEKNIPFKLVNIVHDEVVIETPPEYAQEVKTISEQAIRKAGELLNLRCPMAGVGEIGKTWYEVH